MSQVPGSCLLNDELYSASVLARSIIIKASAFDAFFYTYRLTSLQGTIVIKAGAFGSFKLEKDHELRGLFYLSNVIRRRDKKALDRSISSEMSLKTVFNRLEGTTSGDV